ncbi:MAG: hypothetical protein M1825_001020 [Sarcosagium campestre]|nr:MAG: hypothetical protein M1825_001020 [Sarcosagium campestre]
MIEDEAYRASTQYRLWSFTASSLDALRQRTNAVASQRVRAAIKRARGSPPNGTNHATSNPSPPETVECLTVKEELKLVGYYSAQAMNLANLCGFPTTVKATAVQYLKRFYLSNSPMTYHPKLIMPCALFLATKTENHYTSLAAFVAKVPKLTADDAIAPELLLVQSLRFTLDVRHPFRGLEGGFMELMAMLQEDRAATSGEGNGVEGDASVMPTDLPLLLRRLPPLNVGEDGAGALATSDDKVLSVSETEMRIQTAHGRAKDVLKTAALLTDAYLVATPAQIWLAALLVVDAPLARFYLRHKTGSHSRPQKPPAATTSDHSSSTSSSSSNSDDNEPDTEINPLTKRLLQTLETLASLLKAAPSSTEPSRGDVQELKRIDKKLFLCSNPEKEGVKGLRSAPAANEARKGENPLLPGREQGPQEDEEEYRNAKKKKRKEERDRGKREGEDVFGGELLK